MKKLKILSIVALSIMINTTFGTSYTASSSDTSDLQHFEISDESETTLDYTFDLLYDTEINITLYSEEGDFYKVIEQGFKQANSYAYQIDKKELPKGKYVIILESNNYYDAHYFSYK